MRYAYSGRDQLRRGRATSPVFPTREARANLIRRAMTEGYTPANNTLPSGQYPIARYGDPQNRSQAMPWEYTDRYASRYNLTGDFMGTMDEVPLGGYVRAGLENLGVGSDLARMGEKGLAGLLSAGIGLSALAAAVQGLSQPQTRGTIPLTY